jgi:hypothetical protein
MPHLGRAESERTGPGAKTPNSAVSELCQNPIYVSAPGIALSEKQIPQVVENAEK